MDGALTLAEASSWGTTTRIEALSRTTLLGRLGPEVLADLAARSVLQAYGSGDRLVEQGDQGGVLLVLLQGAVTVYRTSRSGQAALAHLRPPAVIGEVTLLDGSPRSATVVAAEPTVALQLTRPDLLRCAHEHPALVDGLLAALADMVRRLSDHSADAVLLDLPGRVAKTLLLLAGGGRGPQIVRLSQSRIAELAGSSRQSLNQVLSAFAERGLLHVERREVVLDDVDGLRRRAELSEHTVVQRTGSQHAGAQHTEAQHTESQPSAAHPALPRWMVSPPR